MILTEEWQISTFLFVKTDKYEYLTGKEILPSNRRQLIEKAKFTYSYLGKVFGKQTKTHVDSLKSLSLSN